MSRQPTRDHAIDAGTGALCWTHEEGVSALLGVEVPFLPEPVEGERAEGERRRLQEAMAHMARALHGLSPERGKSGVHRTFELRIVAPRQEGGPRTLGLFFLVRSFASLEVGGGDVGTTRSAATRDVARMARMLMSLAPQRLPAEPVEWSTRNVPSEASALDRCGLSWELPFMAELRKQDILTWSQELDFLAVDERLELSRTRRAERERSRGLVAPALLPPGRGGLLSVTSILAQTPGAAVLRVAMQSTSLENEEYKALTELNRDLVALQEAGSPSGTLLTKARTAVEATLGADGFFRFSAQVLGADPDSVESVVAVWKMEYDVGERAPGFETPTATAADRVDVVDSDDDLARAADQFDYGSAPTPHAVAGITSGGRQTDYRLLRLSTMASLLEVQSLWKLPVLLPGGQAGLRSRPSNPFEQLPASTDRRFATSDFITVGRIRHRGVSLPSNFVLRATGQGIEEGPGVLDRVLLVAGSPGSGKTNFALGFLEEMWNRTRTPFLILDPTLGREFRGLAADDLVVFTVGDERGNPFSFNPFAVPRGVSVQTHITRLMSCFRSAFWMWDPLPAIFEEAIRLAYALRLDVPETWDASATYGEHVEGRFPTLDDLADSMDVVLERQEELWSADGRATSNQATIVASTSLRLASLARNYGHIIGGPAKATNPVDMSKMLSRPVVLEMGAIRDGQALSLISSFLLVNLVGSIETERSGGSGSIEDRNHSGYHMLVIEEAHRLLSSGGPDTSAEGTGNIRAQAADDLNTMLAEVRKYRQGVMILDQRPGSLVGGVIDNASVVAMHKLNERKGFDHLSDMLNLSADQRRFARVALETGEAVMLDPVLRTPVLVQPERAATPEGTSQVAAMAEWRSRTSDLVATSNPARRGVPADAACRAALRVFDEVLPESDEGVVLSRVRHSVSAWASDGAISRRGLARACRHILRKSGSVPDGTEEHELVDAMVHVLLRDLHNVRGSSS